MQFYDFKRRVLSEFENRQHQASASTSTFADWVTANWPMLSADMKPKTAKKNLGTVKVHLFQYFGSLLIDKITATTIEDFRATMQSKRYGREKKQYSPGFINDCLRQLHSILAKAARRNVIAKVPLFPKTLNEPKLMLELSADEEAAFIAAFDDRDKFIVRFTKPELRGSVSSDAAEVFFSFFRASKPLFVVALHTGLRRGDLLGLQWSSVDLKAGHIRAVTEIMSKVVLVPLSGTAMAALEECRDRAIASTRWVFVQNDGKRFSLSTLRRHFAVAKELAGITRRFRIHDMRHTAASKMASAGVPLQVIAKVLGHSSTRMSERYARPDEAALRQIAKAMERGSVSRNLNSSLNSKE
jgi:integrase